MQLLIVCTANRCRSPLGEVIATRRFAERGVAGIVASAGTAATLGAPATDGAIITARKAGLDLSAHRSRPVTRELVEWSDLVLTMEPRHTLDVVAEHGASLGSTFTVLELAGLAGTNPARTAGEPIADWLRRIAAGRSPDGALAAPAVDDPIGRPLRHYRTAAQVIDEALGQILDRFEMI